MNFLNEFVLLLKARYPIIYISTYEEERVEYIIRYCIKKYVSRTYYSWDFIDGYSIEKKDLENFDVYVYLIKHQSFKKLNIPYKKKSLILDLNHVLERNKRLRISNSKNYKSYFIGSKQL